MNEGALFVVATPIGNLNDMSPRAIEVLGAADLIAAEDTRVTGRLLSHFGIKGRQIALHDHNEESLAERLIGELKSGQNVALVSDAGTPLISDPGYRLIGAAHRAGIRVVPVPGASALVTALSACGLPTDRFAYEGFLPARAVARQKSLQALSDETRTLVFFESVHRIRDSVADMIVTFGGDRDAFIGRELTKLHEQCVAANLDALASMLEDGSIPLKGEFVIAVAAEVAVPDDLVQIDLKVLMDALVAALPGKQAVEIAARVTGRNRNALYRDMLAAKSSPSTET